jgi:DNA polymerase-3 subunit alpha
VPLAKNDASIVTQFTMTTLEELGLLKMDFLGLRNLTVISDVERMVQPEHPGFSIDKIPLDDSAVFEMFGKGHTNGVFQFESGGMKSVLMQLGPEHMEDLIAVISLYRPGPMESIPRYVRNRHNPELVTYKHPLLRPILEVTYGCIVYQEQVMQICREACGLLLRPQRPCAPCHVEEKARRDGKGAPQLHLWRRGLPRLCVKNGVPEHIASEIFDEMSSFASYAFNKSHAAAYALVSYQTALPQAAPQRGSKWRRC